MAAGVALALPSTSATAANGGATPAAVAFSSSGGAAPGRTPRQVATPKRKVVVPRGGAATPASPVAPPAPTVPAAPTVAGVFPVAGAFTYGSGDARFGAGRPGHVHQGQDVLAASGTPVLTPVAGVVSWKANQPGGAGIYLVVRATDGRDYVFMHLKRGSVLVAPGDQVGAGQQLAEVGATGRATGPHLHVEIWIGGWQARGGEPIDPLPQLERWAAG
jgi:murein DD-endopeptidase MepM/ murein hydrolase activator NlpD